MAIDHARATGAAMLGPAAFIMHDGTVPWHNDALASLLEQQEGLNLDSLLDTLLGTAATGDIRAALERVLGGEDDSLVRSVEAGARWLRLHARHVEGGMALELDDVTEAAEAVRAARTLGAAVEAVTDGVLVTDARGRVEHASRAFAAMSGREPADVIGVELLSLLHFVDPSAAQVFSNALARAEAWEGNLHGRRADGALWPARLTLVPVLAGGSDAARLVAVVHDLSERRRQEQRVREAALHDPLTGLPTRTLLIDRIVQALLRARRAQRQVAVFYIDIENFRAINDQFGHGAGDWLLGAVGKRLQQYLRASDTAARLGGDEFILLLEGISSADEVRVIVSRLQSAFANPFSIRGADVLVSPSIGIVLTGNPDISPDALLHASDAAMYEAKRAGRGQYALRDVDLQGDASN